MRDQSLSRFQTIFLFLIALLSVPLLPGNSKAEPGTEKNGSVVQSGELKILNPTIAHPYYHFALDLKLESPTEIKVKTLKSNGNRIRSFVLEEKEASPDPNQLKRTKRLAIHEAVISPRPEKTYHHPVLIGRLDWEGEETYTLEIDLEIGGEEGAKEILRVDGTAPSEGGYWDTDWNHYQSIVLTEAAGLRRSREPVQATLLYYRDQVTDIHREIRVVRYDPSEDKHTLVPSQIIDTSVFDQTEPPMYTEEGEVKSKTFLPTGSVTIAFEGDVSANSHAIYLVFYGNPDANEAETDTILSVQGDHPGVVVENDAYRFKLHAQNGMLDEVTLKSKPEETFVHKKETNGAIQWNPGCYSPPRAWAHLSDWDLEKHKYEYEQLTGPVMYRTRRWGFMPLMPELECSMEYEFYAGVPYFRMRSSVRVKYDLAAQALRNAEVVFAREAFSEAAWWDPITKRIETRAITAEPDLTEWIVPVDTPWVAFFDREKGCGYAGIQINSMNAGLEGKLRTYNPYFYITTGPWIYWTRALAYPYGSRNPQQMIEIAAESVFLEEWAYLPFELSNNPDGLFQEVERWQTILTHPLYVHVEDFTDDRMEIPEEIYIEPEKSGWEE